MSAATTKPAWGLSPLARGNRHAPSRPDAGVGPIPARTGQPPRAAPRSPLAGAYPRSHGATQGSAFADETTQGLSPLARGNPPRPPALGGRWRPIPARTGQPNWSAHRSRPARAYPRSHGATARQCARQPAPRGLSPLARGNPKRPPGLELFYGPIPARTGQPINAYIVGAFLRAYPRSHGATISQWVRVSHISGLSPLARGNQGLADSRHLWPGPIPARTGQPPHGQARRPHLWAYPRSHGATLQEPLTPGDALGLSPLARGNQRQPHHGRIGSGPIPARTGQPHWPHPHRVW